MAVLPYITTSAPPPLIFSTRLFIRMCHPRVAVPRPDIIACVVAYQQEVTLMGILLSERTDIFHIPYGPLNHDGGRNTGFIDLKANIALIPVLPPCIGWPETRDLLRSINAPLSPFMSLAAHQCFSDDQHQDQPVRLISFVTLCLAEITHNDKA